MKKTISKTLTLTVFAVATSASIKSEPLPAPQSGFYVGAALGGADLSVKNNLLLNTLFGGLPVSQNASLTTTDKNIMGDIFFGYGKRIDCFSIEGEVIGSFASLKSRSSLNFAGGSSSQTLQAQTTNAVGGALKLGYYITKVNKLYLKIGVETRRFKVTFADPSNIFANLDKSYNSTAFVPGLGMEVDLTPRFSLRAEYRAALHPNKTIQVVNSATQTTSVRAKPTIHYLTLGLAFKI